MSSTDKEKMLHVGPLGFDAKAKCPGFFMNVSTASTPSGQAWLFLIGLRCLLRVRALRSDDVYVNETSAI